MPKVAVLSLGGTIAMAARAETGGVTPSLTADDLVSAVPELGRIAEIEAHQVANIPSVELTLETLIRVRDRIMDLEAKGFDGVVIAQGTDTIEETSWLLDLICPARMGIVITGAMRNPTQSGADGPANLLASVQVAAFGPARDAGAVVVFNDQIHAARFVQKSHTSNVGAFTSPSCGPIGWMVEGTPIMPLRLCRTETLELPAGRVTPRVSIIKPGLGEDGGLIDAALATGSDGIVLEATGAGHVSRAVADAAERAAASIPVVLSSRTRGGNVLTNTYGFVGSETDLLARGLIPSGNLDALKARIVLMLSLLRRDSRAALAKKLLCTTDPHHA